MNHQTEMQMKPYTQWDPGYKHCDNEHGWGPQSTFISPLCSSTHSPPDIKYWDSADACDGKKVPFIWYVSKFVKLWI